jgi:hypothetical protein
MWRRERRREKKVGSLLVTGCSKLTVHYLWA